MSRRHLLMGLVFWAALWVLLTDGTAANGAPTTLGYGILAVLAVVGTVVLR